MATDPLLKRLETGALVWCLAVTAIAWLATGRAPLALGVLGGGLLSAVSALAIRTSVEALIALVPASAPPPAAESGAAGDADADALAPPADPRARRRTAARALIKLTGRYALLGLLAYAMIARLRLHPIGLLIGASSLVASASFEAFRVVTRPRRV